MGWCGVFGPFTGCAETPGNNGAVASVAAAGALGDELVAHEIGHMFGLTHVVDATRLMDPIVAGGIILTPAEIATILASPLIQNDGVNFIEIGPILVTPELSTFTLLAIGTAGLAARRRRLLTRN